MLASVLNRPIVTGLITTGINACFWEELARCPICEEADYVRDIAVVEESETAAIASVCTDCEHGFLRRRPCREWYHHFYREDWDQSGRDHSPVGPIGHTRHDKVLEFCRERLPQGASILDVGAGFGASLLSFRDAGYCVQGLEASEHRARHLREVLGIPCASCPIEAFNPSEPFDLIVVHHVLEHVFDVREAIRASVEMLSDQGMLYLAVPDFWQEYPPQAFHFVPHLSWFTIKSLERLLESFGLRVIHRKINREIQLLAVKTSGTARTVDLESSAATRADFWDRCERHFVAAFNGGKGRFTLVWFNGHRPDRIYDRRVFRGVRLMPWLFGIAGPARRLIPARLRRGLLPGYLANAKPRLLTVEISGEPALPVKVRHRYPGSAVWIK